MPITVAADVQRLHPKLDVRVAFERTIVDVERAHVHLVSREEDRHAEHDYVVYTEETERWSCNALLLTPGNSFCDPINGYALYRIAEH